MKRQAYRHGFKAEAERLALEVRAELRVGVHDRLDPRELAKHLAIDILPLAALKEFGASAAAIAHLHGPGREEFSAAYDCMRGGRLLLCPECGEAIRATLARAVDR